MKAALQAFFEYSLVERTAIAVLGTLLLILLLIRCSLGWRVHPPETDPRQAGILQAEYLAWLALQDREETPLGPPGIAESFSFDPNTLDSAGFIRLGMPARAVKGLLNWRRKGKRFYRAQDLEPLYNLPTEVYLRLAPLVHIPKDAARSGGWQAERGPALVELNTADSATLDRWVPGIGAVLAHKIVARREALGGFLNLEQLNEVYRFPDSTMQRLREKLLVTPAKCRLLDLNSTSPERLAEHPYIGGKLAQHIVMYREALGGYKEITQLRQVPLMTGEIYRKIAPYFAPPSPN